MDISIKLGCIESNIIETVGFCIDLIFLNENADVI